MINQIKAHWHDLTRFSVPGGVVWLGFELRASRLIDRRAGTLPIELTGRRLLKLTFIEEHCKFEQR